MTPAEKQPSALIAYWSARERLEPRPARALSPRQPTYRRLRQETMPPAASNLAAPGATGGNAASCGSEQSTRHWHPGPPNRTPAAGSGPRRTRPSRRIRPRPRRLLPRHQRNLRRRRSNVRRAQVEEVVRAYARAFGGFGRGPAQSLLSQCKSGEDGQGLCAKQKSERDHQHAINVTFVSTRGCRRVVQTVMTVEPKAAARVPPRTRLDFTMRKVNGRWLITGFRWMIDGAAARLRPWASSRSRRSASRGGGKPNT